MAYTAQGSLSEIGSLVSLKELFISHGWTWLTAVCVMLFSLMHFPCSTTLLTVKREDVYKRQTDQFIFNEFIRYAK